LTRFQNKNVLLLVTKSRDCETTCKKPMASEVDTCHDWESSPETETPTATLQEADGKRSGLTRFQNKNVLLLETKSRNCEATCKKPMASGVDTCHDWESSPETETPTATLQEADGKRSGYVP